MKITMLWPAENPQGVAELAPTDLHGHVAHRIGEAALARQPLAQDCFDDCFCVDRQSSVARCGTGATRSQGRRHRIVQIALAQPIERADVHAEELAGRFGAIAANRSFVQRSQDLRYPGFALAGRTVELRAGWTGLAVEATVARSLSRQGTFARSAIRGDVTVWVGGHSVQGDCGAETLRRINNLGLFASRTICERKSHDLRSTTGGAERRQGLAVPVDIGRTLGSCQRTRCPS